MDQFNAKLRCFFNEINSFSTGKNLVLSIHLLNKKTCKELSKTYSWKKKCGHEVGFFTNEMMLHAVWLAYTGLCYMPVFHYAREADAAQSEAAVHPPSAKQGLEELTQEGDVAIQRPWSSDPWSGA